MNEKTILFQYNVDVDGNPVSVKLKDESQVSTLKHNIQLEQLPDEQYGVVVLDASGKSMKEVYNYDDLENKPNAYYVNYTTGIVHFNPSQSAERKIINYYGTGVELISAKRVFDGYYNASGEWIYKTLQEIIDVGREAIETMNTIGNASVILQNLSEKIADGNVVIEELTELKQEIAEAINVTGNEVVNISAGDWVYDSTNKMYEYTINHTMNSKDLIIDCYNLATGEFVFCGGKIINNNSVLIKNETSIDLKVVLNARYYKATLTISDDIAREVVDARKTHETVGERLDNFDSQLDNFDSQLDTIENNFKLFKNNNGCVSFTELGGVKNNGAVDNSVKLLEAMNYCATNNKILVLDGKFNISTPIVYDGFNSLMVIGTCPNHNSLIVSSNTFNQENTNLYFSNGATLELNKFGSVTFFGVGFSSTSKDYGTGILLKSFANKFINCKFNQFYKAISVESGAKNWSGENKILYCNFYNCEYCYHATDGSDSEFIGNLIHGSCGVGFYGDCSGYTISLNHFYGKKSNEFKYFNTLITNNYIQEMWDDIPSIILNGSFGCQLVNNQFELNSADPRPTKKSLIEIKTWDGGGNILIDGNNVHGKNLAKVTNLSFIDFTSRDNNGVKDMPITIGTNGIRCCESYFKNNYKIYNIKGTLSYPVDSINAFGGTMEDFRVEVVNGLCYFWVKFSSLPNYSDIIEIPNAPDYEYAVQCKLTTTNGGTVHKSLMTIGRKISLSDYANYTSGEFCGSFPVRHGYERPISV